VIQTNPTSLLEIPSLAPRRQKRLVVTFHGLGEIPSRIGSSESRYWCDAKRFESILDAIPNVEKEAGLPVEITFDDGNASDCDIALPALAKRQLSAKFFVCAGRIGKPGYLDADAIRALLQAGMDIGSHGWNHVDWRRIARSTLATEIQSALDEIGSVTGRVVDEVGIPFGGYNARILAELKRSRVRRVYTSDGGLASSRSWLVPRLSYSTLWSEDALFLAATRKDGAVVTARRMIGQTLRRWL